LIAGLLAPVGRWLGLPPRRIRPELMAGLSRYGRLLAPWLALGPVLGVVAGLFAGGLGVAIAQSLGMLSPIGEAGPSLRHYAALVDDREFRLSIWLTIGLAGVTTVLAAVLGVLLALSIRRLAGRSRLVSTLVQIPLAIPHLSMALFLISILAPSGLLARLAFEEMPFVAVMLLTLLLRKGDDLEAVAQVLGASAWQRLRYVTIPLLAPAALSASLMVLAFLVGAYETPRLLGQTWPALLPVIAWHCSSTCGGVCCRSPWCSSAWCGRSAWPGTSGSRSHWSRSPASR